MNNDYIFISRLALYLASLFYCTFGVIFLILLYKNRSDGSNTTLTKSPHGSQSGNSDRGSKSGSSRTMPVYVTLPDISTSSVISQSTLENITPNFLSKAIGTKSPHGTTQIKWKAIQSKEYETRSSEMANHKHTDNFKKPPLHQVK